MVATTMRTVPGVCKRPTRGGHAVTVEMARVGDYKAHSHGKIRIAPTKPLAGSV